MSCLVPLARLDEALEQMLLAQSLDPVSSIIARDVAVTQYYRRDFDSALEQCDHTIELNPHFAPAYLTLGMIQEQRKDFDESAAAFSAPSTWRRTPCGCRARWPGRWRCRASAIARVEVLQTLSEMASRALRVAGRIHDHVRSPRATRGRPIGGSPRPAMTAASSCSRSRSIRDSSGLRDDRRYAAVAGRIGLGG